MMRLPGIWRRDSPLVRSVPGLIDIMGAKRRRIKNRSKRAGISPISGNDRRKTIATPLSAVRGRWGGERLAIAGLVLATIVCLLPFAGKAVHMDDPLFIWAARQMQSRWWD